MRKTLDRSSLPKWEQTSLVLVTVLILALSIYFVGRSFYIYAFLTEIMPYHPTTMYGDLRERLWAYNVTVGFIITFWGTLVITSFLITFRRVILSTFCFSIPAVFGFLYYLNQISEASRITPRGLQDLRAENPFYPFHSQELLLLVFLIFLILWHIKILIQDKMQAKNLDLKLT